MLHIIHNNHDLITETESMILKCKEIDHKVKVLEAERKRLKDLLIAGYFSTNNSFVGSEGIELATYNSCIAQRFKSTEFKVAHPVLYDDFSELKEEYRFIIKK